MMTFHIWDNYRIGQDEAAVIEAESLDEAVTEFVDTDMGDDPAGYFEFYGPGRELEVMDDYGKKLRVQVKVELLLDIHKLAKEGLELSDLGDGDWKVKIIHSSRMGRLAHKLLGPLLGRPE